jgi:hypothetical protein
LKLKWPIYVKKPTPFSPHSRKFIPDVRNPFNAQLFSSPFSTYFRPVFHFSINFA